jgi:hypothetical protein
MTGAPGTAAWTVRVSVALPVPPEFVADRVTEDVPSDVGVPEMTPVVVSTERPAGRPVALKEVGDPDAVIW